MDSVCLRCTQRLKASTKFVHPICWPASSRTFSTSVLLRDNENPKINSPPEAPTFKISRMYVNGPDSSASPRDRPSRGGQLLRRTGLPPGQLLRKSGSPPTASASASPPQQRQILQRTRLPAQGARSGRPGRGEGVQGKQRRRRTDESVRNREAEETEATEEELDEYMTKFIDRPVNPTERIEYNPKPQEMTELQKDWPNTPLSSAGLSASLIQKIEWLARRIPHGYQTPEQIAERFRKGNLTRFESEEEKQQVLKIASELARQRADSLSERKGSEVAPDDMTFTQVSVDGKQDKVVCETVKGEYEALQRQRMPFLDSIMRNLRNNGTYHQADTNKFMATVEKLMPAQAQRRSQPPSKA